MTEQLPLNPIETAMTISNEIAPLVVVACLRLKKLPKDKAITETLFELQKRHPLLRARILLKGAKTVFEIDNHCPKIAVTEDNFENETERIHLIENELNRYFDPKPGGLMRCRVLKKKESEAGEILLTFHHSVIDGVSARLILHEFLSLCGSEQLPASMPEKRFLKKRTNLSLPSDFTGFSLLKKLSSFARKQFKEEGFFRFKNRGQGLSKPASSSQNKILSIQFSTTETAQIIAFSRKSGIGMNSLISAAMLKAVFENMSDNTENRLMRTAIFANLRPFMNPRISAGELGNYTSMMRFPFPIKAESNVEELGRQIHSEVFKSGKSGVIFLFYYMSNRMIQMILKLKNMRISDTALSYIDVLDLKKTYGTLELEAVHAFITNNCLGPRFSGFGKILFGQLFLDCNYLPSETFEKDAKATAEQIRTELLKISRLGTHL